MHAYVAPRHKCITKTRVHDDMQRPERAEMNDERLQTLKMSRITKLVPKIYHNRIVNKGKSNFYLGFIRKWIRIYGPQSMSALEPFNMTFVLKE